MAGDQVPCPMNHNSIKIQPRNGENTHITMASAFVILPAHTQVVGVYMETFTQCSPAQFKRLLVRTWRAVSRLCS